MTNGDRRRFIDLVTEKLHTDWDPIGCDVPWDEYKSYAGPVISMVEAGESVEAVARYLAEVRTLSIGLRPDPAADLAGARAVYAMISEYTAP
ncbi:MAG: hypothetical protein KF842_07005 [Caulobacter sp.]|nr:hypothetical protein [Caulobacter sp.]